MTYHKPVLINEVLEHLQVNKDKKYIDCTLGDGGHTLEILKRGGRVLGIDYNPQSLERSIKRISDEMGTKDNGQFIPMLGNFKDIEKLAKENDFYPCDGILFDLGYSSYQLDELNLGLTFLKDEDLDMRLDKSLGVKASDLINTLSEKDLSDLIYRFSDERQSRKIAKTIVKARALKKIQTTKQLSDLIASVTSPGYEHGRINPATRTFQALRIAVNDEIYNLECALPRAARVLLPGGRMLVITFHSLEDRVVKHFGQSAQPMISVFNKKPIEVTQREVEENSRSRSAKLRVFIRN